MEKAYSYLLHHSIHFFRKVHHRCKQNCWDNCSLRQFCIPKVYVYSDLRIQCHLIHTLMISKNCCIARELQNCSNYHHNHYRWTGYNSCWLHWNENVWQQLTYHMNCLAGVVTNKYMLQNFFSILFSEIRII